MAESRSAVPVPAAAVERAAAGCVLASFDGVHAPAWVQERIALGLGGTVLFASNVRDGAQVARLTACLRRGNRRLLVAADEEGGEVTRLEAASGSSQPAALALGALDAPEATAAVAAALARSLRRAGVDLNLAPVADLLPAGGSDALGSRAFGGDPARVARHVAAFVAGTQREGVAACLKHFPGHGGTSADSHLELARAEGDLDLALEPFRAGLAVGARAVMPAHLVIPALDGDAPASLSRAAISGLLREQLGFDGLVVTDALDMRGALLAAGSVEEAAVRALDAGADALCLGPACGADTVDRVVRAIAAAVRAGRLARRRVEEARERVACCGGAVAGGAAAGGATDAGAVAGGAAAPGVGAAAGHGDVAAERALGARVAARALVARGAVAAREPLLVVELDGDGWSGIGRTAAGLGAALRRLDGQVRTCAPRAGDPLPPPGAGTTVAVVRDAEPGGWQAGALTRLLAEHPRAVVVETGTTTAAPAGADGWLWAGGAARVSLDAAAARLLGR